MPATVSEISAALKTALSDIPGLRVFDYQPDQLNPPVAIVNLNQLTFHRAFGGGDAVHQYLITVVVNRPSERSGQASLDGYMSYDSASSVRAAIEADKTLGGVVDDATVERAENVQYVLLGDTTYLTADFVVTVHP
jgi:hypothetical protein